MLSERKQVDERDDDQSGGDSKRVRKSGPMTRGTTEDLTLPDEIPPGLENVPAELRTGFTERDRR